MDESFDFPRYCHLDLALSGDSAGLAIGHCRGFKRLRRSEMVDELMPIICLDVLLEIRPPPGGEINFEKIRKLLYMLLERGNIRAGRRAVWASVGHGGVMELPGDRPATGRPEELIRGDE